MGRDRSAGGDRAECTRDARVGTWGCVPTRRCYDSTKRGTRERAMRDNGSYVKLGVYVQVRALPLPPPAREMHTITSVMRGSSLARAARICGHAPRPPMKGPMSPLSIATSPPACTFPEIRLSSHAFLRVESLSIAAGQVSCANRSHTAVVIGCGHVFRRLHRGFEGRGARP